jgi:FkbM family methyltransferase
MHTRLNKNNIKNLAIHRMKRGLAEIDNFFALLLDHLGIYSLSRVPRDPASGVCGPVNIGREPLLDAVVRLLKGQGISGIVDCGAYYGHLSRTYAQKFPDAIIYAFEPVPESFRELQLRSEPFPRIKPFKQALAQKSGKRRFFETVTPACSSLSLATKEGLRYHHQDYPYKQEYEVEVTTLDHWWKSESCPPIQFIKMDVQGGELEVMKGATQLLKNAGVLLIQAEVAFFQQYAQGCVFTDLDQFLRDRGFCLYQFYELWTASDGRLGACDALFINSGLKKHKLIGD